MVDNKTIQKNTSIKARRNNIDYTILIAVYTLVIIGIVMVFSASSIQAQIEHNNSMFFLKKQIIFAIMGTFGLIITSNINYNFYKKYSFEIYMINIFLLLLTLYSPLGKTINQARRWLKLGFLFQTSEFSKFAVIVMMAKYISGHKNEMTAWKNVLKPLLIAGVSLILISREPSYSAALTIAINVAVMLFISGISIVSTINIAVFGTIGASLLAIKKSYRLERLLNFSDPFKSMTEGGWQAANSIMAIASGGLFGKGFGKSTQKYFYLPQPQNDFIFAIIGEELGFFMSLFIILIYIYLIFRIFRIFVSTEDTFAKMLSAGIGLQLGIQTFLNLGVATGGLPNTGVGLPFISYGGTSLIIFLSMIGVLLNISKHTIKRG